jgi:hypothetical protein
MITARHARYLRDYPERIGRERRLRRIKAKLHKTYDAGRMIQFRTALKKYAESHPAPEPIRAGKKTLGHHIKNLFRKPTV